MEWRDEGIVLALHRLGEHDARLELLTPGHGRVFGVVKGGLSRKRRGSLQPGTTLVAHWRARLETHLGVFTVEPKQVRTIAINGGPLRLDAMASCCLLASLLLAERDAHPAIYDALEAVLDLLDIGAGDEDPMQWVPAVIRFELGLLGEVGSGLDLNSCAATGVTEDLVYVSPKSARAVSREAGAPYHDRMLSLPAFLRGVGAVRQNDLEAGLALTGFFLERHLMAHDRRDGLPDVRHRFARRIAAAAGNG
jgi:DNA repair protein RecO (recombination protein O)